MSIAAFLIFGAQMVTVPDAARWEALPMVTGLRTEIDPTSLVRSGDRVHFILRAFAPQPRNDGGAYLIARYVIDCRARTWSVEIADFYREDGSFTETRQWEPTELVFQPVAEGRDEAVLLRRTCPAPVPR
jgi:hypothetical protein